MRRLIPALFLLAGCPGGKEVESLIDPELWVRVPLENDPWAASHPGEGACPEASVMVEDLGGETSLGIDGIDCAYLTIEQPSLVEVENGDVLRLRLWHFALTALDASTATIAMTVGEHTILDEKIPVPAQSNLIRPVWMADFDAPAGSRVLFHLENHGSNSYNLIELSRGGELPEQ